MQPLPRVEPEVGVQRPLKDDAAAPPAPRAPNQLPARAQGLDGQRRSTPAEFGLEMLAKGSVAVVDIIRKRLHRTERHAAHWRNIVVSLEMCESCVWDKDRIFNGEVLHSPGTQRAAAPPREAGTAHWGIGLDHLPLAQRPCLLAVRSFVTRHLREDSVWRKVIWRIAHRSSSKFFFDKQHREIRAMRHAFQTMLRNHWLHKPLARSSYAGLDSRGSMGEGLLGGLLEAQEEQSEQAAATRAELRSLREQVETLSGQLQRVEQLGASLTKILNHFAGDAAGADLSGATRVSPARGERRGAPSGMPRRAAGAVHSAASLSRGAVPAGAEASVASQRRASPSRGGQRSPEQRIAGAPLRTRRARRAQSPSASDPDERFASVGGDY